MAFAFDTRITLLIVARSEPSEGIERIILAVSPSRFETKVEEPPPSQLTAFTQPNESIISPIS